MSLLLYRKPGLGWRAKFITSAEAIAKGYKKIAPATWRDEGATQPPAPPTATLSGSLPLVGDGTVAITIQLAGGFPLASAMTAAVSFNAGTAVSKDVTLAQGDTAVQAAGKIASATGLWNADVAAVASSANVVVTPAAGKTLTALAVSFK